VVPFSALPVRKSAVSRLPSLLRTLRSSMLTIVSTAVSEDLRATAMLYLLARFMSVSFR